MRRRGRRRQKYEKEVVLDKKMGRGVETERVKRKVLLKGIRKGIEEEEGNK